ncbi:MFS transporter [Haloarchaeobius salinus]|uniref:MFS transporter n=1 Tax=Haloarchaeobius salinus TaxID=1198298 RepID=UPI00210ECDB9|nr:MFS transporter [Haloarchaeobius salinus]
MESTARSARLRLALVVWGVLVSQVFLYPGLSDLVVALGAPAGIQAGMWFLVAEFAAFVTFAGVWGVVSDVTGKRVPWVVVGAVGGAACYILLTRLPAVGFGWGAVLVVRLVGGALTIGAFSLAITMLMDLSGGHGRNMGAAGIAIGLGAALGSVVGGQLSTLGPLTPLYASATVLFAAGLLAATVPDRTPTKSPGVGAILDRLRDRPSLGVPYAFGFIDRSTAGFFSLVGVYYFRDVFDLDAAMAGVTLACFFLPFALLQYPFGSLSDRIGRFLPVVGGSVVYGLTIVAVGVAPVYPLAALAMVAAGVCGALMAPATMALVTDIASEDGRGAAMGGFNVFGSLGFLTGFLVGGLVVESANYLTAFLVVGGLELAIALLALPAVRRVAPSVGEQPS